MICALVECVVKIFVVEMLSLNENVQERFELYCFSSIFTEICDG